MHTDDVYVGTIARSNGSLPSPADMTRYQNQLGKAAKRVFGMTEGAVLIPTIHLYQKLTCDHSSPCDGVPGNPPCNICIREDDGCNTEAWYCPGCQFFGAVGSINLCGSSINSAGVIAHEFGHAALGLVDEYSGTVIQCGHSTMGDDQNNSGNICYRYKPGAVVVRSNHPKDPSGSQPAATMAAAWDQLWNQGITPQKPSTTPDTYRYETFDFRGAVGRVWLYYAQ
jgi:hypothetical protein